MVEKLYVIAVAPHTGAWIETVLHGSQTQYGFVAPHTGAWIETYMAGTGRQDRPSLPIRERGLKPSGLKISTAWPCRSPYGSVD